MFQGKIRMENIINILNEEIIVFEVEQDAEVQENTGIQANTAKEFRVCGAWRNQSQQETQQIIQSDTYQNDSKIVYVKITIEPQGHAGQKKIGQSVLAVMVQSIPAEKNNWKKYKNKDIGIE